MRACKSATETRQITIFCTTYQRFAIVCVCHTFFYLFTHSQLSIIFWLVPFLIQLFFLLSYSVTGTRYIVVDCGGGKCSRDRLCFYALCFFSLSRKSVFGYFYTSLLYWWLLRNSRYTNA